MSRISATDARLAAARNKRGRPRVYSEEERKKFILKAAEDVFTAMGYGAATVADIARVAGMSKKTLYGHYKDKKHLLAEVIVAADDFPWEDSQGLTSAEPLVELHRRLLAAAEFTLSPRQIRLTRLLISEAEHMPELADDFHDRVMVKCTTFLQASVEEAVASGLGPAIKDMGLLTKALFGAVMTDIHLWLLFGKTTASRQQLTDYVDAALTICGFVTPAGQNKRGG